MNQPAPRVHMLRASAPIGRLRSLFFFSRLTTALVLYRCSLSSAITLRPSLPRLHTSSSPFFPPSSLAPRSDNLIKGGGGSCPWGPPPSFFITAVTLSGEEYSFIGFLSLSFPVSLSHCSLLLPLLSPLLPQSLPLSLFISPVLPQISPSLGGGFPLFPSPPPPPLSLSGYMSPSLFSTFNSWNKGTQQSNLPLIASQ